MVLRCSALVLFSPITFSSPFCFFVVALFGLCVLFGVVGVRCVFRLISLKLVLLLEIFSLLV